MLRRRKLEGLLAASLYEPLTDEEQEMLEEGLAWNPALRRDADRLRAVVDSVPVESVVFQGDLLPALREAVRTPAPKVPWLRYASGLATVALVLLAAMLGYRQWVVPADTTGETTLAQASIHSIALAALDEQVARGDFAGAAQGLQAALEQEPDAVLAGETQLALAELEFRHWHRYPQAFEAYRALRAKYSETFTRSSEAVHRFELLDEVQARDFEPLLELDRALNMGGEEAFSRLEKLVALNTGTRLASLAVDHMAKLAGPSLPQDQAGMAVALAHVRERCTDPNARAQVGLELGTLYWRGLRDPVKAREELSAVTTVEGSVLAQRAREVLAALDSPAVP